EKIRRITRRILDLLPFALLFARNREIWREIDLLARRNVEAAAGIETCRLLRDALDICLLIGVRHLNIRALLLLLHQVKTAAFGQQNRIELGRAPGVRDRLAARSDSRMLVAQRF